MKIATDPSLIDFEGNRDGDNRYRDLATADCTCAHCLAYPPAAPPQVMNRARGLPGTFRRTGLAAAVVTGVSVIGVGAGTGVANAEPAPSHAGWDGSRYWFKSSAGGWRWTSHRDVYVARTGGGGVASSRGGGTASGIKQGWDGSRYWFRSSAGEWRWTSHRAIYLARTGGGGTSGGGGSTTDRTSTPAPPPSRTAPGRHGIEPAVDYALDQLGKPYVWGGNGPYGFDCSGLVQQAYLRVGIHLPRVAADQYAASTPMSSGELRRGDLLFWSNTSRGSGIHHVAIYLGAGKYVEAPRPGKNVRVSSLDNGYTPTHFGRPG